MKRFFLIILVFVAVLSCVKDMDNPLDPTNSVAPSLFVSVLQDTSSTDSTISFFEYDSDEILANLDNPMFYVVYGVTDERDTDVAIDVTFDEEVVGQFETEDSMTDTLVVFAYQGHHNCVVHARDASNNSISDTLVFRIDDQAVRGVSITACEINNSTYDLYFQFESICGIDVDKLNTGDSRILFSIAGGQPDTVVVAENSWSFNPQTDVFSITGYSLPLIRETTLNLDYILYDRVGNSSTGIDSCIVYSSDSDSLDFAMSNLAFGPSNPVVIMLHPTMSHDDLQWYGVFQDETVAVTSERLYAGVYRMKNVDDFSGGSEWTFTVTTGEVEETFTLMFDDKAPYIETISPGNFYGDVLRDSVETIDISFSEGISEVSLIRTGLDATVVYYNDQVIGNSLSFDITLVEELNDFELRFTDYAGNTASIPYRLCYYPEMEIVGYTLNGNEYGSEVLQLIMGDDEETNSIEIEFTQSLGQVDSVKIGELEVESPDAEGSLLHFNFSWDSDESANFSFIAHSAHQYGSSYISNPELQIVIDNDAPYISEIHADALGDIQSLPVSFSFDFNEEIENPSNVSISVNGIALNAYPETSESSVLFELTDENFSPSIVPNSSGFIVFECMVFDSFNNVAVINESVEFNIDRTPPVANVNDEELQDIDVLPVTFSIDFDEIAELQLNSIVAMSGSDEYTLDINPTEIETNSVSFELTTMNFSPEIVPAANGDIRVEAVVEDDLANRDTISVTADFSIDRTPPEATIEADDLQNIDQLPVTFSVDFEEVVTYSDISISVNGIILGVEPEESETSIVFELTVEQFSPENVPDASGQILFEAEVEDLVGNSSTINEHVDYTIDREAPEVIDNPDFAEFDNIPITVDTVVVTINFIEELDQDFIEISLVDSTEVGNTEVDVTGEIADDSVVITVRRDDLPSDSGTCVLNLAVKDLVGNRKDSRFEFVYSKGRTR